MKPLLTHIIPARNDDYLGNFKHRLELAVNYTCENVKKSGNLDAYELLICDWNSEQPLRKALNLNEAARQCACFLEVPPPMALRHSPGGEAMHLGIAVNVPARRAHGEFIMVSPADVLFPLPALLALFALLRGEIEFPADIRHCYLGIERYLIPWQASERLRLQDLDRYFLLHTTHMPMGKRYHSFAGGEGAHLLSHTLWHELRGVNETYARRGAHEVDLARRAAHYVPQLKATLAGVYVYDLQQCPDLEQTKTNNEDVISLIPTVNDADWGLAQEDIFPIPAEYCPDVKNEESAPLPFGAGKQQTQYYLKLNIYSKIITKIGMLLLRCMRMYHLKDISIEKLLSPLSISITSFIKCRSLLFNIVFQYCAEHWTAQRFHKQESLWFCGEWFGERPRLLSFFAHAWKERVYMGKRSWSLHTVCFALAVLAVVGRQRPTRFFHAAARETWVAQCAAFAEPTLEISGYDHWLGQTKGGSDIHLTLKRVSFQGYYHFISGPLESAFKRLRETQFAGEPYHCLALDLDFLQTLEARLYANIEPLLADSCTIILGGRLERQKRFGATLLQANFLLVALLPEVSVYIRNC